MTPMGRPVVKRVLADFRINLTVSADDYEAAVQAGALFDEVNGVLFVPRRVDLMPVSEWLPFSLDGRMHNIDKVSDDYGIIASNPSIPKAAGPTKMDGSPNMTYSENIRVARMLKPAMPGGLGGSGPRSSSNSSRHRRPSLSPEPPPVPESVFIAAQMRAVAAPFATKLAWVFAVLFCALMHKNIEALIMVVYALMVHAVFHLLQIQTGSQGGVGDRNVSLFDMASSPSNIFHDALGGDAMAVGIISSILVLACAYRRFILRRVQSAWHEFNIHVNQHV